MENEQLSSLKAAGFTAGDLKDAGVSLAELITVGFPALSLKLAGFPAWELEEAGFGLEDLVLAGYSAQQMRCTSISPEKMKEAGFCAADMAEAGYAMDHLVLLFPSDATSLQQDPSEENGCGEELPQPDVQELKASIPFESSARRLRHEGVKAGLLLQVGFQVSALASAGYTLKQLRDAGAGRAALLEAGFNYRQLEAVGLPGESGLSVPQLQQLAMQCPWS